ncbi:PREDICTED: mitochondrial import inner membrane translocase subunit Tim9-like [Eufriesea mexicana]|uniref:mitochondrial import inner membrane translocase subunit Tim9-like n=1 Tax=Eufriesea mexicana TaxID=516756 RepID=UPI00083BFCB5|nr:PREDICTED: mitochondrial import inner membrane translocase subunit Tim9-like [Eufriesea mexicana]XP_017758365.1 PREDICTED: mitochondrial import inner membrane translocase subunit Tim9-like [Eufriesea mexicana]
MTMQVPTNVDPEQIKSVRDFVVSYNKLTETCFLDCIHEFTSRDVKTKEETCALNCMEKFLKMNQRISQRFEEFQLLANENILAAKKKLNEDIST